MTSIQKEKTILITSFILGLIGIAGGIYAFLFSYSWAAMALLIVASLNIGYNSCKFFEIKKMEEEELRQKQYEVFRESFNKVQAFIEKTSPLPFNDLPLEEQLNKEEKIERKEGEKRSARFKFPTISRY